MIDYGNIGVNVKLTPPPTHTECVKAVWEEIAPIWCSNATEDGLIVVNEIGQAFDFKQIRYGRFWVVECDGVVVRRIEIADC